jgi:glycosidase
MRSMENLKGSGVMARFANNHDTERTMSEVGGDMARARAAAVWLLTAPGTPTIYYGEEIGMSGRKGNGLFNDHYRREPFDWYASESGPGMTTWFKPEDRFNKPNDGVSVEEQQAQGDSLWALYTLLGNLRRENPLMREGRTAIPRNTAPFYVLQRWHEGALLLVIINFTTTRQVLADLAPYTEVEGVRYDAAGAQVVAEQGSTSVPGGYALETAGYLLLRLQRVP